MTQWSLTFRFVSFDTSFIHSASLQRLYDSLLGGGIRTVISRESGAFTQPPLPACLIGLPLPSGPMRATRAASSSPSRPNKLFKMEDSIDLPSAITDKAEVPA